jgi:hypothetical protein
MDNPIKNKSNDEGHETKITVITHFWVTPKIFFPFLQKYKKIWKKEKNILCIRPSVSKLKKSYCVFYTPKNNVLTCNFDFNNQFSKVKRTLTKISKTTKILFCLSFSIRGTKLHVMRISDINFFFFFNVRTGFTPLR